MAEIKGQGKGNFQEEKLLNLFSGAGGFASEFDRLKREKPSKKATARLPKEILRQQTRPKPVQGDLFSVLPPTARKNAILANENGGILSQIVDGIDGGEIASKVVIALALTLYEQSELYGTTKDLSGATERLLPFFDPEAKEPHKAIAPGTLRRKKDGEEYVVTKDYVTSLCPIVYIKLSDFTKLALGLPDKGKADRKDKDRVRAALEELASKKVYMRTENGQYLGVTIIGKQRDFIDPKRGAEVRLIELDAVFTKNIMNDFAVIRKDTLKILRGRQTKITMRLLYFLLEQFSYNKPTFPLDSVSKEELFSRIAIIKKYERHPEERERDFKEALSKMVELHLIEPIETTSKGYKETGGYYETFGADGYTLMSHFRFNPKYKTAKG